MAGSDQSDMNLAIILFGFFLGLFLFTSMKVAQQSWSIWNRTRSIWNVYLWMIWIEVLVNFVFAATTYMFLQAVIPPR
jgi:TRAP-type mannitol/chloroaromatic compound transport system permease small subunit